MRCSLLSGGVDTIGRVLVANTLFRDKGTDRLSHRQMEEEEGGGGREGL